MDELDIQAWLDAHALSPDEVAAAQAESDVRASQGAMEDVAATLYDNPNWSYWPIQRLPNSIESDIANLVASAVPYATYAASSLRAPTLVTEVGVSAQEERGETLVLLALAEMGLLPLPPHLRGVAALGTGGLGVYNIAKDIEEEGLNHYLVAALAKAGPGMVHRSGAQPDKKVLNAQLGALKDLAGEPAPDPEEEARKDALARARGAAIRNAYEDIGKKPPDSLVKQQLRAMRTQD